MPLPAGIHTRRFVMRSKTSPSAENLEPRRLLAATFDDSSGVLTVAGNSRANRISISISPVSAASLTAKVDGVAQTFALDVVTGIVIEGRGGNDRILFDESLGLVLVPSTIFGSTG